MSKKHTIEYIKGKFKERGCTLLEDRYIDAHTLMKYTCNCGKESKIRWNNFRDGQGCYLCRSKKLGLKQVGKLNHNWKGGRVKDKDGYIKVSIYSHPYSDNKGYIYEHRLVMEKHIGRYLKPGERIHHKNLLRDDNSLRNLKLYSDQKSHWDKEHTRR